MSYTLELNHRFIADEWTVAQMWLNQTLLNFPFLGENMYICMSHRMLTFIGAGKKLSKNRMCLQV